MSNATKTVSNVHKLVESIPAANADLIGETFGETTIAMATESTATGWDAYDVWRRFIKEARDRRRTQG